MSRSGYSDDCEYLELWRGAVASATNGRRGQKLFRELLVALDAMPEKRLIANELEAADGEHCALGVLGKARGIAIDVIDPEDRDAVGKAFDIAPCLAAEVVYENDEGAWYAEIPEQRWQRMRNWVARQIKPTTDEQQPEPTQ